MRWMKFLWVLMAVLLTPALSSGQEDTVAPEDTLPPPSAEEVDWGIKSALSYLQKHGDAVDFSEMLNYYYLYRKFDIPQIYTKKEIGEKIDIEGDPSAYFNSTFYRLLDQNYSVPFKSLEREFYNDINEVLLRSLYCDTYPIDSSIIKKIRKEAALGGYHLTHAYLAMKWMEESECLDKKAYGHFKDSLIGEITVMIDTSSTYNDLTLESMAFVQYSGHHDMIKPEWVRGVLEYQREDCGWKWSEKTEGSDPHATILGLWVLLEWKYPGRELNWISKEGS